MTQISVKDGIRRHRASFLDSNQERLIQLGRILNEKPIAAEGLQQVLQIVRHFECKIMLEAHKYVSKQDFCALIADARLSFKQPDARILQAGCFSDQVHVLLLGTLACTQPTVSSQDCKQVNLIPTGIPIFSSLGLLLKPNAYLYYTVTQCAFLTLSQPTFTKIMRKYIQKQCQDLCNSLARSSLLEGVTASNLKRFLSRLIPKRVHYKDYVYTEKDKWIGVYYIMQGQVIIQRYCSDKKMVIKLVRLSKGEIFGLERNDSYYIDRARAQDGDLELLLISSDTIAAISQQFPSISGPILESSNNKTVSSTARNALFARTQHILTSSITVNQQKNKRKLFRRKKKLNNKLEWWGLASHLESSRKYKLPEPPKVAITNSLPKTAHVLSDAQYTHKIQQFKRRVFDLNIDTFQRESCQFTEQNSPYQFDFMPKLNKVKRKMLNATMPKVIDGAQKIRQSLLTYAKNATTYCDTLNFR